MKKIVKFICILCVLFGFCGVVAADGTSPSIEDTAEIENITNVENTLLISSNPNSNLYYQESIGKIFDMANLLNSSDEQQLLQYFKDHANIYQYDIAMVTLKSLNGKDAGDTAHGYIDRFELGYHNENGAVLLLISVEEREWYIAGYGPITSSITNRRTDIIGEEITPSLSSGNYFSAGHIFADTVASIYSGEYEFSGIDSIPLFNNIEDPIMFLVALGGAMVVVGAISAILPNHFKAELQNIAPKQGAKDYIVRGSFTVSHRKDNFITKTISKTKRSSDSSSSGGGSRSSGGGSRSGGGGRF